MISPQELSQPTWTRTPRRASQVPRPISRRAPSPTTPDSPVGALARCFPTGSRLPPLWKVGHCQVSVTRPNRVRLTRAHVFTVRGFNPFAHGATDPANRPASRCQLPLARDRSSMPNEQFAWLTPFNQLDRPGLTWRTRDAQAERGNCFGTSCVRASAPRYDSVTLRRRISLAKAPSRQGPPDNLRVVAALRDTASTDSIRLPTALPIDTPASAQYVATTKQERSKPSYCTMTFGQKLPNEPSPLATHRRLGTRATMQAAAFA